jgi:predicted HicB family RNase H-like nuclease
MYLGKPKTETKQTKLILSISPELKERLVSEAKKSELSLASFCKMTLRKSLDSSGEPK